MTKTAKVGTKPTPTTDSTKLQNFLNTANDQLAENLEKCVTKNPDAVFPLNCLGYQLVNVTINYANGLGCPTDYVCAVIFSAVATSLGNKIDILSRNYHNYPALWSCLVGRAGAGKTVPVSRLFKPILLRDKLIADAALNSEEDSLPVQYVLSDCTAESRISYMQVNGGFCTLKSDELLTLLNNLGRYTGGTGDESALLSMFSEDTVKYTRKTGGSEKKKKSGQLIVIPRPTLSIVGGIQPGRLPQAFGPDRLASGLLDRFLFVYPDPKPPVKDLPPIPQEATEWWNAFLNWLMDLKGQITWRLSDEAQELYDQWRYEIDLRIFNDAEVVGQMLANLKIYALRLSGIIHLMQMTSLAGTFPDDAQLFSKSLADLAEEQITKDDMVKSIELARYFSFTGTRVRMALGLLDCRPDPRTVFRDLGRLYPKMNKAKVSEATGVNRSLISQWTRGLPAS